MLINQTHEDNKPAKSRMIEDIQRRFDGDIVGDCYVIVVRLGALPEHARIYIRTEDKMKEILARLAEQGVMR